MAKSTLSKIAKKTTPVKKAPVVEKTVVEKKEQPIQEPVVKNKIQETVDKLIEHVDLLKTGVNTTPVVVTNVDNLSTVTDTHLENNVVQPEQDKTILWYEEQLSDMYMKYDILVQENTSLKTALENNVIQESSPDVNFGASDDDLEVKKSVFNLFMEIQDNHLKWGENFIINPSGFLDRLVLFFPFLESYRSYQN